MDDESLNNDEVNKELIRNYSSLENPIPSAYQQRQNPEMSNTMRFSIEADLKISNHISMGGNEMLNGSKMTMPAPSMLFYPNLSQNSGTEFLRASRQIQPPDFGMKNHISARRQTEGNQQTS